MNMWKNPTLKPYLVLLGLIWLYVIAGVFFAQVVYPGTLNADSEPDTRTVNIRFGGHPPR